MENAATNFLALSAPVSILLLLGTVGLVLLSLTGAAVLALSGHGRAASRLALSSAGLAVLYAAALLGTSLAVKGRVVPPGGGKAFCEIDCHVVYTAAWARVDDPPARGRLARVGLVALFDRSTISKERGDAPLTPNPRQVFLEDSSGRRFAPVATPSALTRALRPGESAEIELSFRIPEDAAGLRLLVTERDWPTRLLIGHENAPLSGKTYFALPA